MEELRTSGARGIITTDEVVYEGLAEQGVELDYLLPDYCPDIFRIIRCCLIPKVLSYNISGDSKLDINGMVLIKVLYTAEGSDAIHCIDQRYTYTKTIDMGRKVISPTITISTKSDYCNCRAVSSRRIDVRGAVSCNIRAVCSAEYSLPSLSEHLQVKAQEYTCCAGTLNAEKLITLREDIDTGASGISFIIHTDCSPKITDMRIIADKAVIKGEVTVNALYGLNDKENSGCTETEKMTAEIPVSVILDIPGITDEHRCTPRLWVMDCELTPSADSSIISCELKLQCTARAHSEQSVIIPTDVYSTAYESDFSTARIKLCTEPSPIAKQFNIKSKMSSNDGEVGSVWDCKSEVYGLSCRTKDGVPTLSGQVYCTTYGKTTDGVPFFTEKNESFEQPLSTASCCDELFIEITSVTTDTSYSINSDGMIDVSILVDFNGSAQKITTIDAVDSVSLYEDRPKEQDSDYALRIFYANDKPLDCWSVAKKYNTTVGAVMRENGIEDENATLSGMIIIPTV